MEMDMELRTSDVAIESRTMKSIDNLQSQSPTSETRFSAVRDVICSDGPLQNKVKANPPTSIVKSHSQRRDVSKSVSMKEKRSNSMPEKTRRSSSTTYSRTVSFTKFRADLSLDSLSLLNREKFDTPILETRPESYMWLAICTTLFFNPVLGIIALVTSMQADREYLRHNMENSKKLGKAVKIISIIGISCTLVTILVISLIFSI